MSMSSYGVIVPGSRLLINMNAQLDDHHTIHVHRVLVITRSANESAIKIQEYEERVHSMLLDDWHAYRTIFMEFTTDHKSVATARLLDGSQLFGDERDPEGVMMIARLVMQYVCGCTNGVSDEKIIQEHLVEICGKDNEEEKVEEEICVICQKEFEAGEMCHALECAHWYHLECIDEWLRHASFCPICRETVY